MTRLNPKQTTLTRQLAVRAAACALSIYDDCDYKITIKSDQSPVTQADLAVSEILEKNLPSIADYPVLSEENKPKNNAWTNWETYWLIDPIDGTRHFINRTGDFCICIALIHQHCAVFGLIIAPTTGELWLAQTAKGSNAMILEKYVKGELTDFPKSALDTLTVALSAKMITERMGMLLSVFPVYTWYNRGSALKYTDIAEGKATLYPKLWDTCEWDSAAGQCILDCAGGGVVRFDDGKPVKYGESVSLINPHFFAHLGLSEAQIMKLRDIYPELPEYIRSK